MPEAYAQSPAPRLRAAAPGVWLGTVLVLVGAGLAGWMLSGLVSPALWWPVLARPNPARVPEILAADGVLPRLAVSLLCGAALGLSGALAQVALRNPLAAPDTLGVSAGAQLALSVAVVWAPGLVADLGRGAVAAAGGTAGLLAVGALTWRGGLRPATVALAGLAVTLYLGSAGNVLAVLHTRLLAGLFVWNAGSLVQLGWDGTLRLLPVAGIVGVLVMLLRRPLALLDLPDGMARGLGVPVGAVRVLALALSVLLASAVTGTVGTVGFVGLLAPALARAAGCGAGKGSLLIAAPLLGAGLLAATDGLVARASGWLAAPVPTGAVTTLAGFPLLLWLLVRAVPAAPALPVPAMAPANRHAGTRTGRSGLVLPCLGVLVLVLAGAALLLGPGLNGWAASLAPLEQRAPRVLAAAIAGGLLGLAGTVLQRVLDNPVAGPEVLGLGTGTVAGTLAALWLGFAGPWARAAAGLAGAGTVMAVLLPFGRGAGGAARLPIAGIALSASATGGIALLLASGDPRAEVALAWVSGSTYGIGLGEALAAVLAAAVLLLPLVALLRPLDLLSLGTVQARALGLPVGAARAALLGVAAALTALATLLAGPLSFAGLMAPHGARLLGLRRAPEQAAGAALAGAGVMVAADWFGRTALFPYEIPAGLAASLLGGPVLAWALARNTAGRTAS